MNTLKLALESVAGKLALLIVVPLFMLLITFITIGLLAMTDLVNVHISW